MTVAEALAALGVDEETLTPEERERLDRDGFVLLHGILDAEQVQRLNGRLAELLAAEGADSGKEVHQEEGTDRLADLVNKDPAFDVCFTHPRVLAAIAHVLGGDMKLSSLNFRAAVPGAGHQALHADWDGPVPPGAYQVCNSIWLLDEFTVENGATRVVPGSHRNGRVPEQELTDPEAPHPDETLILAPAGTVGVFNSHTWHGGTQNRTDGPRRAIHSYWTRRHNEQQLDQRAYVRPATLARLDEPTRFLLDVA